MKHCVGFWVHVRTCDLLHWIQMNRALTNSAFASKTVSHLKTHSLSRRVWIFWLNKSTAIGFLKLVNVYVLYCFYRSILQSQPQETFQPHLFTLSIVVSFSSVLVEAMPTVFTPSSVHVRVELQANYFSQFDQLSVKCTQQQTDTVSSDIVE